MAVKNAVAKAWQKTGGGAPLASFDGKVYSGYLNGDKPSGFQTAPKIVGTDLKAITLVNNYNGQGSWLKVFGYGLGSSALFGSSTGARIFLRDPNGDNAWHEVSTYTAFEMSRTFARNQLLRLTCQVGNLGGSQTSGRVLDVKITVNGVDTNILTAAVTNQGPRDFYFASPAGNDTTGVKNDITKPYRYVQYFNTTNNTYSGIWAAWARGDTIVIRGNGGTWTDQIVDSPQRWVRFPWGPAAGSYTGTAPTGSVNTGYYTFYGMPGEDVHGSFNNGGGIQGCSSAQAQSGYGKYVQISGMRIDIQGGAARDAGPVNLQNGADHWVVTDMECGPWVAGSSSALNSSGIGGQGTFCYIGFNYVHNIEGLSDLQNHGMYFGGVSGGTGFNAATTDTEVCYNWVQTCTGGSGIQFYWQGGNSQYFTNNKIHHNFVETTAKYGINLGESSVSFDVYNNIVAYAGWSALRFYPLSASGTLAINIEHNTFFAWNQSHGATTAQAAILNEGFINTGAVKVNHNIIAATTRGGSYSIDWYSNNGASDTTLSASQNLYWDPDGVKTTAWSIDAAGIFADPKFSSTAGLLFTLLSGSSALDAVTTAASVTVGDDYYGIARPAGTNKDIGACEGVGT